MTHPAIASLLLTVVVAAIDTNRVSIPTPSPALDAEDSPQMPGRLQSASNSTPLLFDTSKIKVVGDLAQIKSDDKIVLTVSSNWTVYALGKAIGQLQGGTNWVSFEKLGTNETIALPIVQQAMLHAWNEGCQFGVSASLQNRTLVEMQDGQALMKAATFMGFGQQKK